MEEQYSIWRKSTFARTGHGPHPIRSVEAGWFCGRPESAPQSRTDFKLLFFPQKVSFFGESEFKTACCKNIALHLNKQTHPALVVTVFWRILSVALAQACESVPAAGVRSGVLDSTRSF